MSLPWERGLRETPAETPEPTITWTPPASTSVVEGGDNPTLDDIVDNITREAKDYALKSLQAALRGEQVDHTRPVITVTNSQGKEIQVADAKNRSFRTLVQGFALDFFFALIAVVGTLSGNELASKAGLATVGVLVLKTLLQTAVSYISRMRIEPTIKTPEGRAALVPVAGVNDIRRDGEVTTRVSIDAQAA